MMRKVSLVLAGAVIGAGLMGHGIAQVFAVAGHEVSIFDISKEALANVLRHSGADQVAIACCINKAQQALMLEINDNGIGLPGQQGAQPGQHPCGKGLRGMRARAHQLGGQLQIESTPHRGTRVRMLVPLMSLQTEES